MLADTVRMEPLVLSQGVLADTVRMEPLVLSQGVLADTVRMEPLVLSQGVLADTVRMEPCIWCCNAPGIHARYVSYITSRKDVSGLQSRVRGRKAPSCS